MLKTAPGSTPPMAPDRLPRRLGVVSAAGVLVGIVIGSGIFRVPSVVAAEVGSTGGAAMLWVLGAVVTLCGALTMAELATAFPRAGGPYVILREAWGPLPAFLFGWIKLVVTGPAGIAAVALIFAAYASAFVPLGEAGQRVLAAALVAGLSLVNIRSVPWSARVQNLSTLAKVLALVLMAALLFAFATPGAGSLGEPVVWSPASWSGFGVALIAVLWTYVGWMDVTYLAGEMQDPGRTIPRAMVAGLGTVVVVYLLINAAYLYVLPMPDMVASKLVAATAAERVFGAAGSSLVAALVMLATFGSLNATLLSSPRVFFAMAEDGLFFRSVAAVHPRYRTPHVAVTVLMVLGILGVTTNTFEQLAQIFVLGIWPFYALSIGAVFLMRRRGVPAAYRTWGYPVVPIVFLVVSVVMLVNGAIQRPGQTAISLGILLLGVPVFYAWRTWNRRALARAAVTG